MLTIGYCSRGCNLYQMVDTANHAHDRGIVFLDNRVIHFLEAEGIERALFDSGAVDAALDLFDLNLCHCLLNVVVREFISR